MNSEISYRDPLKHFPSHFEVVVKSEIPSLKTNSLPLKIGQAPKGTFIFQASIFMAYVTLVTGRVIHTDCHGTPWR